MDENQKFCMWLHDIKNLLFVTSGYITLKNLEKAKEKIFEICEKLPDSNYYEKLSEKNQLCLNKLVESKVKRMNKKSIFFEYENFAQNCIFIKPQDLCLILGNALDNATEACEKILDTENRYIKLKIKNEYEDMKNFLIIDISNSISEEILENFSTTKKLKTFHGFGMKSIRQAAQRYGGNIEVKIENGIFNMILKLENTAYFFKNQQNEKCCISK